MGYPVIPAQDITSGPQIVHENRKAPRSFNYQRYANTGPHSHPHPDLPLSRGVGLFTLHCHCYENPFSSSNVAPAARHSRIQAPTTRHSEERSDEESKKPRVRVRPMMV